MKPALRLAATAFALQCAFPVFAQVEQPIRPPIAVYWISVETSGGMGIAMPMGLGGLLPSSMQGGRRMKLDLGSSQTASGDPRAAHAIPPGLAMGESLPLVTPRIERAPSGPARPDGEEEHDMQPPKGRMLLYWGCGETVRTGQPLVFDFARMDPQEAARVFRSRSIVRPNPPSQGRSRSYGTWPNPENSTAVPGKGSLRGEHRIAGNYSPDIRFTVDERHDFMDAVVFDPVSKTTGGALAVKWKTIPTAIGYFATAMGRGEGENDLVMWSSSELQDSGQSLMDYVPPVEVQRLIREKRVMPPQTNECTVPAGVFKGEGAMLNFIAYGNELNIVHPPRPSDPKQRWDQEWAVKVRLKSTGMTMLGEGMGAPRAGTKEDSPAQQQAEPATPSEPSSPSATSAPPKLPGATDVMKEGINVLRGIFGR